MSFAEGEVLPPRPRRRYAAMCFISALRVRMPRSVMLRVMVWSHTFGGRVVKFLRRERQSLLSAMRRLTLLVLDVDVD